jgi:hypothetical protein
MGRARAQVLSINTGQPRGPVDAYITSRYFHRVDAKHGGSTAKHPWPALTGVRLCGQQVDVVFDVGDGGTGFLAPMNIAPASAAESWVETLLVALKHATGEMLPQERIARTPRNYW